jgi:hypothetical protein
MEKEAKENEAAIKEAYKLFLFDDDEDWPTFFMEQYIQSVITTPFIIIETLSQAQIQSRSSGPNSDLHIASLQADFPTNLRKIIRFENQGYLQGLFRGHFTQFIFQSTYNSIQPIVEEQLNEYFNILDDINPYTMILSHTLTASFTQPLEMAKTRLIVQSNNQKRKMLYGPFHALYQIAKENHGVFNSFWFNKHLLPTMFTYGLGAGIRYASVFYIENELGLDSTFSPVLYKLAQLAFLGLEVFLLTPLELARKRLFVQRFNYSGDVADAVTIDARVETQEIAYSGVINCLYNVVKNEGGADVDIEATQLISKDDWRSVYGNAQDEKPKNGIFHSFRGFAKGVGSMYRGFWPRYVSRAIIFIADDIKNETRF